jgi:hypothetical protein
MSFVIAHEYCHHYWGHSAWLDGMLGIKDEIPLPDGRGSMEDQRKEAEADGLAVYFVLTHLLGEGRL